MTNTKEWEKELKELLVIAQSEGSDLKLYHEGHFKKVQEFISSLLSRHDAKVVEKLRSFAEAVARTDKTPRYEYERTTANKNNEGKLPGMGQRWSTPREMARDVLAALKDQNKEQ